jgi:predicted metal-dependent hydrolase
MAKLMQTRAETCMIEMPWGSCNFILKRSRRKSVGFLIGDGGLQISAPPHVGLEELHNIIRSKSNWIRQRLALWETRRQQTIPLPDLLSESKPVPVRGESYRIEILSGGSKALLNPWNKSINLPACERAEQQLKQIEKLLKAHAREVFTHMASKLVARQPAAMRLPEFSIHLSSPTSRWGSCNNRREVRLNWRLVHYPPRMIEYVIAHELAHLVEMNHSARFWAVVESLMPDYREPHKALSKMNPAEVPVL